MINARRLFRIRPTSANAGATWAQARNNGRKIESSPPQTTNDKRSAFGTFPARGSVVAIQTRIAWKHPEETSRRPIAGSEPNLSRTKSG